MALTGLLRSKLSNLIVSSCSKHVVKTSLPALTTAVENYESRKGLNYIQCRGRRKIHIPPLTPIDFRSGDLEEYQPPPVDEVLYKYKHIKDIDSYPGDLKKLFTVAYATEKEKLEHQHMELQEKLSSQTTAEFDYEKLIGFLTVKIRHLKVKAERNRRNKGLKHYTFQRIDKRDKFLNYLKRLDIEQYHKILKELNIDHSPKIVKKLTEKEQRIKTATDEANVIRLKKQQELERMFLEEKEKFSEYKQQVLKDITQEAKENNIDLNEILQTFAEEQRRKEMELQAKPVKMGKNFVKFFEEEKKRKELQKKIIPDPFVLGLKKR